MTDGPAADVTSIDVPFSSVAGAEQSGVLRVGRTDNSLFFELVEVWAPEKDGEPFACCRIFLPSHAGPEILDTLFALLDDNAPSAIAAIDQSHTWVADRTAAKDRLSLEVHPGDVFEWESSRWHVAFDLPIGILPDLADAVGRLVRPA